MINIAVIGDMYSCFTIFDVEYLNQSLYDLILSQGALLFHGSDDDQQVVKHISSIRKTSLLIPGNCDCVTTAQFSAEAIGNFLLEAPAIIVAEKLVESGAHTTQPGE